jgi:hypothetical protein
MIVMATRAAVILGNLLRARDDARPYLVPANACSAIPTAFLEAQQAFELVDLAEPSLEIDVAACVERLRAQPDGYAGVVFIRGYGRENDPTAAFRELRQAQPSIFLIDDRCLGRPDVDGHTLSPLADVTLFSTGDAKYAELGGGGFAFIAPTVPYAHDDGPAARRAWSAYRQRVIAAADAADRQKAVLNAIYARALPEDVQLPAEMQCWRFNILVPEPERLETTLFADGLFASRHYAAPPGFPVAGHLHRRIVNLFNDHYFDEARATRAATLVNRHLSMFDARRRKSLQ